MSEPKTPQEWADHLVGSCETGPGDEFTDEPGFAEEFDDLVRNCECCGWWVETHEISERGYCEECEDEDPE